MSIVATKWAWSLPLPPTVKLVLAALADHADERGECWPLQSRIAEMTGLTDRAVRYVMHGLKLSGLVRANGGKGRRGVFFLALDVVEIDADMASTIARECVSTGKKRPADGTAKRNEIPLNRNEVPNSDRNLIPIDRNDIPMNRNDIPNHRTTNNYQEPPLPQTPENQFELEAPNPGMDAEFNEFWSAYPRKNAKAHARKAYAKARKTISASALLAAVKAWPFDEQVRNGSDFRPYAASWLNGERWEDESVQIALAAQQGRERFPAEQIEAHQDACRQWRAKGMHGPKPKIEQFALECA